MNDAVQGHQVIGGATKRGAPDPGVRMPDGVKAAAERANALVKQSQEAKAAAPPGSDQPIGETIRAPQERAAPSGVVMANFDPRDPNPPREVLTSGDASKPPQAATPQSPEDWEHQFKSLKGRYDRDTEEKRQMARQLQETQRLLATLSVAPSPPPQAGGEGSGVRFAAPPPPGRHITPQQRTEFGDELLDVVGRRAQEVYEPVLQQVIGELNQIKRQVGGVQNTVAYDARVKMYEDLAHEVPNWNAVNDSPQFAQWLDQPDPISGAMRRQLLNMAHNSNLAGRVIAIFRGFLNDLSMNSGGNSQGYVASGNGATPPNGVDLAQFAAPGRLKPGGTEVPREKPIFDAKDIPQFYRDKTAGKFAGREEEMNAIEAALFEAGREGRIRR